MAWQKQFMASSKFLKPIIHILNLIMQMSKFELNKDMRILGHNSDGGIQSNCLKHSDSFHTS